MDFVVKRRGEDDFIMCVPFVLQGDATAFYCSEIEEPPGENLCESFPFEYVTEIAAWLTFFHYRLTHLPLYLLAAVSGSLSVGIVVLASKKVS